MGEEEQAAESSAEETTESTESPAAPDSPDGAGESADSGDAPSGLFDAILTAGDSEQSTEAETSAETTEDEDGTSGDEDGTPEGAPEEYAAFEVPDGLGWSDDTLGSWNDVMRESNLSQEGAQAFLDNMAAFNTDVAEPALKQRQDDAFTALQEKWKEEIRKHPALIGEDGQQLKANIRLAEKVLDSFDAKGELGEGVKDTLTEMGWLYNPQTVCLLVGIGRSTLPDSMDAQGDPGVSDDWDNLPAHKRMGWDENAEPIRKKIA